ncbi:MAG: hypothetical protein Q8J78_08650 [Moraxellaceae bacterium]|nr:hypothetical protein [Moraxellaceae bacterium]
MYQTIITIVFSLMMLGAATGLYIHGKRALAISLGLAVLVYHTALQYIIHSTEAPGFTESLSLQYRVALHAMDFSIFVQLLVTLVVCWRHLAPQPKKY